MALLKNGMLEDDLFTDVTGEDIIPWDGAIIVSVDQWEEHRDEIQDRKEPIGIVLRSDQKPALIESDLQHFSVIALEFPTFRDGRAYSYARLLRERCGYEGELRAVGDVLLEQLHFMHRVGFNAFEIKGDDALHAWEVAMADIDVWYQPTNDGRETAIELRHNR